jgi:hypothetical protein
MRKSNGAFENRKGEKNYYYVNELNGKLYCYIGFKTNCKNEATARRQFEKWLDSQPFGEMVRNYGYVVTVYKVSGGYNIDAWDDIDIKYTLWDKYEEVEPSYIIPLF